MKRILALLMIGFLANNSTAQEFNFGENQVKVWELAKSRTIAVAEAMPESKYNYKPTDQVTSFGQQMTHIANSMLSMNNRFILEKSHTGREKMAADMTKKEIIADLVLAFDEVISTLKGLSDQKLLTTGKKHGEFPLTKWQSFLFMRDHITNHRAKAVLYLRMNGVQPPRYGFN